VYTSQRSLVGPVTQILSWAAKPQVVFKLFLVNKPWSVSRVISAWTVSLVATSTPMWLRVPPWPGLRTSVFRRRDAA